MRTQIPLNGISTSSSYADGECLSMVNLRKKNGALKPVAPRKVIKQLAQNYDLIFVHQLPSTGENWLGVRNGNLYHFAYESGAETWICEVSTGPSITQIGNVLNVLDSAGLKHIIWYESKYIVINSNFDGEQDSSSIGLVKVDLSVSGTTSKIGTMSKDERNVSVFRTDSKFGYSSIGDADSYANRTARKNASYGLIQKALSITEKNGLLTGFCLACTAVELYDGSYILHSQPVLLGQSWDMDARYSELAISGVKYDYSNKRAIFSSVLPDINLGVWDNDESPFDEWDENNSITIPNINRRYGMDTVYAFKPDSDDLVSVSKSSVPNIMGYWTKRYTGSGISSAAIRASILTNKLRCKIKNSLHESYRPIVRSVCVFMTPQVQMCDMTDQNSFEWVGQATYTKSGSSFVSIENHLAKPKSNTDIIKELALLNFYKVKEIPFDELVSSNDWIDLTDDLKGKLGENLFNQDMLPVDNFTHHALIPKKQYVYNSRLHALNYTTILSRGFPINYFYGNSGVGQMPITYTGGTDCFSWISVKIKTDSGVSVVTRHQRRSGDSAWAYDLAPILSYPDSRAISMTIFELRSISNGKGYLTNKTFKLTAHDSQNFAYYINPNLSPIYTALFDDVRVDCNFDIPSESRRAQIYENGLKVSSLNNPLTFPLLNTYLIGSGKGLNISSNAMRTSDGQFGQYPLYVFTSENIYALNVGSGETVYTNQTPVSNETPVSDIICPTPFGVVFVGTRGLFVINGQQVDFISAPLEQYPIDINLTLPEQASMVNKITGSFAQFLTGLKLLVYDPHANEIIAVGAAYSYVYNVDSKQWYQSTEKVDMLVGNVYPRVLAVDNSMEITVVDIAEWWETVHHPDLVVQHATTFKTVVDVAAYDESIPVPDTVVHHDATYRTVNTPAWTEYNKLHDEILVDEYGCRLAYILPETDPEYQAGKKIGILLLGFYQSNSWQQAMDTAAWLPSGFALPNLLVRPIFDLLDDNGSLPSGGVFDDCIYVTSQDLDENNVYAYGMTSHMLTSALKSLPCWWFAVKQVELQPIAYHEATSEQVIDIPAYDEHIPNPPIIVHHDTTYKTVVDVPSWTEYIPVADTFLFHPTTYKQIVVNAVKDYSVPESSQANVSFITRPINFGYPDLKKLERVILRARLKGLSATYNGDEIYLPTAMNYISLDGINFKGIQGRLFNPGDYKDVDMGLSTAKHRQVVFIFAGSLSEDSEIGILEAEINKEYQNTKMR